MASPTRSFRALVGTAAVLLALAGCGGDDEEVVAAEGASLPIGPPEVAAGTAATMVWQEHEFTAADGLPALGDERSAHRVTPDPDAMETLAERVGVEVVTPPSPSLEPPALVDLHGSWMYWDVGMAASASATCDSDGNCSDNVDVAPANVSEEQAEGVAEEFLDGVSVDLPATTETSATAGTWVVTTSYEVDGHDVFGLVDRVVIGEDGDVVYAMGFSGTVQGIGDYPTVDTAEAVARLNDGWFGAGQHSSHFAYGSVVETEVSSEHGASVETPDTTHPDPETATTTTTGPTHDVVDPAPPTNAPMTTTTMPDPPPPMPDDPPPTAPPGPILEPPPPTPVTLVDVEWSLVATPAWDRSGVYLLPAYVFTADDGAEFWVLAVDDSVISPAPADEPGSPDEAPAPTGGSPAAPSTTVLRSGG